MQLTSTHNTTVNSNQVLFSYIQLPNYSTQNTRSFTINYMVNNVEQNIELHIIDVNLSKLIKLRGGNLVGNIISAGIVCQKFTVVVLGSLFTNIVNTTIHSGLENYVTNTLLKELKVRPNLLLMRDYATDTVFDSGNKYKFITNDIVMNFDINPAWSSIQDYCLALSKKYKARALKTIEAAKDITIKEFSLAELQNHQTRIMDLFNQVINKQELSIIEHTSNYFTQLKVTLGTNFKFFSFVNNNNELLAFMPIIMNGNNKCEVHYIGYDAKHNSTYKLYQNILMQALAFGIDNKITTINFGHTSLEAKAILGTKPTIISHAYKTNGLIANYMINHIVKHLNTEFNNDWRQRNPFKE
jgi:hypothetical protein